MIHLLSLLTVFTTIIYLPIFLDGAVLTPMWFSDDPLLNSPKCTATDKPCDILVRSIFNGLMRNEYRTSQSLCSCPGEQACPTGWDNDPNRTITRNLVTRVNVMELQMKFCEPIQTERECEPGENAMITRGGGVMALEIVSISCRCPINLPLHLTEAWYEGWRLYQKYQCDQDECVINHTESPPCIRITRMNTRRGPTTTTHYPCRCASGFTCSVDPSRIAHLTHVNGHCERFIV